jgi:hypothetical protein
VQFADIFIQLSCLRFPQIGRLDASLNVDGNTEYLITPSLEIAECVWTNAPSPFSTAIHYFFTTRKAEHEASLKGSPEDSDGWVFAWLKLQCALAVTHLPFNHGPFPLRHPDMG